MLLDILAVIFAIVGVVGAVIPALPGPPLTWFGLLLKFWADQGGAEDPVTLRMLLIWLAITTVVTILDYILPATFTKLTGGHKEASTGATIGMIAGIFLTPIGMLAGAFLGAFIGELTVNNGNPFTALIAAIGSFIGFIFSTGLKLATCLFMTWIIIF